MLTQAELRAHRNNSTSGLLIVEYISSNDPLDQELLNMIVRKIEGKTDIPVTEETLSAPKFSLDSGLDSGQKLSLSGLATNGKLRIEAPIIPGRKVKEKFVYFVRNILSNKKCKEWIACAEAIGFQPASLVKPCLADSAQDKKISCDLIKNLHRSNDRVLLFDSKRSALLTERLKSLGLLPLVWPHSTTLETQTKEDGEKERWGLVGLNERLSFLR